MTVPIPNRPTPPGAEQWLADLIDYILEHYCDPRQAPSKRLEWFAARIICASAHAGARETEIMERAGVLKSRKGGAR